MLFRYYYCYLLLVLSFPFFSVLSHPDLDLLTQHIESYFAKDQTISEQMIEHQFYALPRHLLTYEELRETKYLMQHWRMHIQRDAGSELKDDGPQTTLDMIPISGSKWPFKRWSEDTLFSKDRYRRDENGHVHFFGHSFEVGDIILVNQQARAEGIFGAIFMGPSIFPHAVIYVEIEVEHRIGGKGSVINRYPAVFEFHHHGVRLVPLNVFLSSRFIAYAEIYRLKESHLIPIIPNFSKVIKDMMNKPHGYNFYMSDGYMLKYNYRYMTCTQLLKVVVQKSGYSAFDPPECMVGEMAHENLSRLGLQARSALTPTGFMRDPDMKLVGVIDHHFLRMNIIKEVITTSFHDLINNYELRHRVLKNDKTYQFIKAIFDYKIPLITHLLLKNIGDFKHHSTPIGPSSLIASVLPIDKWTKKILVQATKDLTPIIDEYIKDKHPFSFDSFLHDPRVAKLLSQNGHYFKKYFNL